MIHLYTEADLVSAKQDKAITRRTKVEITCSVCNKDTIKNLFSVSYPFVCQHCNHIKAHNTLEYRSKYQQTLIERYGDAHYNNRVKAKETSIKLYGGVGLAAPTIKAQVANTMVARYKTVHPLQNKDLCEKSARTKTKRYQDAHYNNRDKAIRTNQLKYGAKSPMQNSEVVRLAKATKQAKYGNPTFNNSAKTRQTLIEKYGVPCVMHIREAVEKAHYRYRYNGLMFDSSYELAFYIWASEHGKQVTVHPDISFPYEYNGITHIYNPDFAVDGTLVEYKGLQFFRNKDANDVMVNPYDHSLDDLYEAKHQCMIRNRVTILTNASEYINYIKQKYGAGYLRQFKMGKQK